MKEDLRKTKAAAPAKKQAAAAPAKRISPAVKPEVPARKAAATAKAPANAARAKNEALPKQASERKPAVAAKVAASASPAAATLTAKTAISPSAKVKAASSVRHAPVHKPDSVPAARRPRAAAASRKVPARRLSGSAAPQVFPVSHLNDGDFRQDGLRSYAKYRDLGIAAVTGGLCQAHVIRLIPPCTDEVRKRHAHSTELQLVYVLQGWVKNEFEGQGEQMMSVGSCWLQPSGIRHTVLDYSPDCELLEIIVPANFMTEEVA